MILAPHRAVINSFHAVDKATGNVITADSEGFISPAAGTTIVFPSPYDDTCKEVLLSSVVFTTNHEAVKVVLNDNEMYPMIIDANSIKGIDYMFVRTIKVISGSDFKIEALSNDHELYSN